MILQKIFSAIVSGITVLAAVRALGPRKDGSEKNEGESYGRLETRTIKENRSSKKRAVRSSGKSASKRRRIQGKRRGNHGRESLTIGP